jgi:hypothetical protein
MPASQDAQTAAAVQAAQLAAASAKSSAASASAAVVNLNAIAANALFWQGTYNANVFYAPYAVVLSSDILYVSLQGSNKDHTPASSPSYWQAFGSAGGSPAPSSSITGLDFTLVEGVPTLRETPAEIAGFGHGLNVGLTSDDADPLLAIGPGQLRVNLGPSDEMFLGTTTGNASMVMSGATGEIDIFGQVLDFSSNGVFYLACDDLEIVGGTVINMTSNENVNINAGGNGNVNLGVEGDMVGFLGATAVPQQVGGEADASASYTSVEQDMLNASYHALQAFGLLS